MQVTPCREEQLSQPPLPEQRGTRDGHYSTILDTPSAFTKCCQLCIKTFSTSFNFIQDFIKNCKHDSFHILLSKSRVILNSDRRRWSILSFRSRVLEVSIPPGLTEMDNVPNMDRNPSPPPNFVLYSEWCVFASECHLVVGLWLCFYLPVFHIYCFYCWTFKNRHSEAQIYIPSPLILARAVRGGS